MGRTFASPFSDSVETKAMGRGVCVSVALIEFDTYNGGDHELSSASPHHSSGRLTLYTSPLAYSSGTSVLILLVWGLKCSAYGWRVSSNARAEPRSHEIVETLPWDKVRLGDLGRIWLVRLVKIGARRLHVWCVSRA